MLTRMPGQRSSRTPVIMGVLNVTPDSFSDGGDFLTPERAIARGRSLASSGADIIDVGGESTRPGATPLAAGEELERILPVIRALTEHGIAVSVDTLHAETAEAAVRAGARFINDVSGGTADEAMLQTMGRLAAHVDLGVILGHWRGIPHPDHSRSTYDDVVAEVAETLERHAHAAMRFGVPRDRIVIDPGLGFDKTDAQGWALLGHLPDLLQTGFPVLVGASRKRMLGEAIEGVSGIENGPTARDLATAVVSALSVRSGAWGVRVHDVPGTAQALAVTRAWELGAGEVTRLRSTGPLDTIAATGIEVFAHHGVLDFEREQGQRFLIDVEVACDASRAAQSDDLANTINYAELTQRVAAAVEGDPVDLIETVAERAAAVALGFSGVCEARVTVHKPDAPIDATFADVSVRVVRRAPGWEPR